jgi:hypothetical protein
MLYEYQRSLTRSQAGEQFRRLHGQAVRHRFWSALTGKQQSLLNLDDAQQQMTTGSRSHRGVQLVPLAQIRGSEGRSNDFDVEFRPLREHNRDRWVDIAIARSEDRALPPVSLVQINNLYFVRDGHHRISVAKMMGQVDIEAEVTIWRGNNFSTN